jgi:hypothetical protein
VQHTTFDGDCSPETRLPKDEGRDIMEVDAFQGLSFRDKLLLNHFITHVSQLMSHTSVREQACQILPVALETPSLLYATLAFSALHLSTLVDTDTGDGGVVTDTSVADILACSITHLRQELDHKVSTCHNNTAALLHTVKTLCLFEIYSGKYDSSWRAHLKGARALLKTTARTALSTNAPGGWLLARWYISIEALSALTNDETRDAEQRQAIQPIIDSVATQGSALDIYAGYSADLHLAFKDIGGLMQQYASARYDHCGDDILSDLLRHCDECIEIEQRVERMIARDKDDGLRIPAEISLSTKELRMFSACNTAYQYSALLHIRRRLYNMPPGSEQVQQCVRGILDAVCNVLPVTVLSPWILLTTPIFTAGYVSLPLHLDDRYNLIVYNIDVKP